MKKITCGLTCLALLSVLALGADAPADQKESTFLAKLKPDQPVSLTEKDGRYELGIFPANFRPQPYTVIEIGRDYVVVRDLAEITSLVIPIYQIRAIRIMKVPTK